MKPNVSYETNSKTNLHILKGIVSSCNQLNCTTWVIKSELGVSLDVDFF